jgi:glutamate-1-semialdehyde 2,1-aminomutase
VIGEPPLFDVFFTDGSVENYRDVLATDAAKGRAFNALLRERGIFKGDSKYYISLAHDEADIQQTLAAFKDAAKALKGV